MTDDPIFTSSRRAQGLVRRRPRAWAIVAFLLAGALVALLAFGLRAASPNGHIDQQLRRGHLVAPPPFTLPVLTDGRLDGAIAAWWRRRTTDRRITVAELRGRPTVVNFWASWCGPCRDEAPLLEGEWRTAPSDVLFLGVNQEDNTGDARAFLRRYDVSYPTLREAGGETSRRWGLAGFPETYFLSRRGLVVGHVIGVVSAGQLRRGVAASRVGRIVDTQAGGALGGRRER